MPSTIVSNLEYCHPLLTSKECAYAQYKRPNHIVYKRPLYCTNAQLGRISSTNVQFLTVLMSNIGTNAQYYRPKIVQVSTYVLMTSTNAHYIV